MGCGHSAVWTLVSATQVPAVYPRHIVSYFIIFSFLPRIITIELIDLSFDICFLVSFLTNLV